MARDRGRLISAAVIAGVFAMALGIDAHAQMTHMPGDRQHSQPPAAIRMTMDELHAQGGVPRGWKFSLPPGDAGAGRQVFLAMECFVCHEVRGEESPRDSKAPRRPGPALTGMGSHHPATYFAESILSPNRVIILGPGYTGADGLSTMPSYADTMTVKQLVDVVAYLTSLTAGGMEHGGHHMHTGGSPKTGTATKSR
jgi:mono/diheme cytochrome c family protein